MRPAHSDMTAFWKKYPPAGGVPSPFTYVPSTQPHSPVGTEAALDTQFSAPHGTRAYAANGGAKQAELYS